MRVHLSRYHAHVFPGSFRTHCRGRIECPPLPPRHPTVDEHTRARARRAAAVCVCATGPILRRFTSKLAWSPGLIDRQVMGQFNLISKINNHHWRRRSIYSEVSRAGRDAAVLGHRQGVGLACVVGKFPSHPLYHTVNIKLAENPRKLARQIPLRFSQR